VFRFREKEYNLIWSIKICQTCTLTLALKIQAPMYEIDLFVSLCSTSNYLTDKASNTSTQPWYIPRETIHC